MIIKKIFNNNAILARDLDNNEVVVMGSGIGFKKSVGETIEEKLVEKTFILKQKDASEKFKLLLEHIPSEHITLCGDIIDYAKNTLEVELNDYIYVTLTDHISNVLKLLDEGFTNPNPLIWEIKKFYPKEFKVALKALDSIEEATGKRLPKVEDVAKQTKMVQDILNIVKYTFNIALDEKSISYERFVTHLRFFFQRLNKKQELEDPKEDDFLLKQVKAKYKEAYECMLKVEKYLEVALSDEEQLYLTIHIQRVTQR
jgi:beta-glucoside operon transcriptional antiterminator